MLIARLAAERRCYEPERIDATWARSWLPGCSPGHADHRGDCSRAAATGPAGVCLAGHVDRSGQPVSVQDLVCFAGRVLDRCGGDLQRMHRLGLDRFAAAVRRELPRWHGIRPNLRVVRAVAAALADPYGVTSHRPGSLKRAGLVLADWQHTARRLADTETRIVAVLDELGLTELVTSIAGLTPVSAVTILAETGDLTRFRSPRSVVKHAGLCRRSTTAASTRVKAPFPVAADLRCGWRPGSPHSPPTRRTKSRAGPARTSLEDHTSRMSMGAPPVSSPNSIARCRAQPDYQLGRARADGQSTAQYLTSSRYVAHAARTDTARASAP